MNRASERSKVGMKMVEKGRPGEEKRSCVLTAGFPFELAVEEEEGCRY